MQSKTIYLTSSTEKVSILTRDVRLGLYDRQCERKIEGRVALLAMRGFLLILYCKSMSASDDIVFEHCCAATTNMSKFSE